MAEEPWNRVNIPPPGAVSCVRMRLDRRTGAIVKSLRAENDKVAKLLESEILQTEIRLLYELLYILHNSYAKNKTFRVLKQVEQCINRLKEMKLHMAFQDLTDLCPTQLQRELAIEAGECSLPSQPMLEWLCLKVLGAAKLMSCTINHCSRAFILVKQHLGSEQFVVLNVVLASMLSRLWAFFRGILANLAPLYQLILQLLKEVSCSRPMPFLTNFSLPADMAQFLGLSDAFLLTMQPPKGPLAAKSSQPDSHQKSKMQRKRNPKTTAEARRRKRQEDLGVPIQRDEVYDIDAKSLFQGLTNFTKVSKSSSKETQGVRQKQKFQKQVRAASTFTDIATHMEDMITWCKSQNLKREKRYLSFLYLKCQKRKSLESAGYKLRRKLRSFKQEACWASSPRGSVPRTLLPITTLWRSYQRRTRCQLLKTRYRSTTVRVGAKRKRVESQRERTGLLVPEGHTKTRDIRASTDTTPQTSACGKQDEIDDIFSSMGF